MSGDKDAETKVTEPAGKQLKRARERMGLALSAVADEQHLRPSVIQSIENGDYGKIDSELFLKGYVRAYARQVGLDADTLIQDLDLELEPLRQKRVQEQQSHPLVSIEKKKFRKRKLAKVLVILLLLAGLVWLATDYLSDSGVVGEVAEPATANAKHALVGQPDPNAADDTNLSSPSESQSPLRSEAAPAPLPKPVSEPEEMALQTPVADVEAPLPEVSEEAGTEPESIPEDQVPVISSSTESALQSPQADILRGDASASDGRLEIGFTADCWVQVIDASGNRLVSSLQRSGDRLDVTGATPLRVVIGAMNAVESIRFQGESLESGSFRTVNNRAEFTLEL